VFSTPYGFPSGHAFRTLFLAGVLWSTSRRRSLVGALLLAAVVAVDFSLVYLGDHWASEVIAGDLLAGICLGLVETLVHPGVI
jgi:membrane-associated phospholipid phosphatase